MGRANQADAIAAFRSVRFCGPPVREAMVLGPDLAQRPGNVFPFFVRLINSRKSSKILNSHKFSDNLEKNTK
jgi:hypothetical protein